jgi:hypothetical protein
MSDSAAVAAKFLILTELGSSNPSPIQQAFMYVYHWAIIFNLDFPTNKPGLGLTMWHMIKPMLPTTKISNGKWNTAHEEVIAVTEYMKEHNKHGVINEPVHFIKQSIRIPAGPLNIRKILQLALNLGQLRSRKGKINNTLASYLVDRHAETIFKLNTYLSPANLCEINKTYGTKDAERLRAVLVETLKRDPRE